MNPVSYKESLYAIPEEQKNDEKIVTNHNIHRSKYIFIKAPPNKKLWSKWTEMENFIVEIVSSGKSVMH